ncbi:MAG: SPOR domain-containing protein [Deltaproteobacteria bacterium]|nr:SPOR domain-containing protein [Deltaproteobacteria bacterium]
MKDEPTPQGHKSSYPEDDRLVKDLESSDKTIGSIDSLEVASDIGEDPSPYYKILQINPEAPLSDIHQSFEKMNKAWQPDRYPHVISWEDKAKKKLKEIRNAYEKLMRLHPRRESASQGDEPSTPLLATTVVRPEYSDQERPLPTLTATPSSSTESSSFSAAASSSSTADSGPPGNLLRRVIGIGLPTVVILILMFLWPSLYHYEAINLGGKEYPLRINRITSHTTYYDGKQWLIPPVQVEMRQQKAAKAPPVQPEQPVQPLQPAQLAQTVQPAQSLQSTQPVQPPSPSGSSRAEFTITGKPSSLPQPKVKTRPAEKEVPPPKVVEVKINVAKPYSIQIIAYPEKDKAVALAKRLRGGKIPVRVEEVAIKGKGRWHRVLLGKFKNRDEALKYFNDHKIGKLYPQSFIQKAPNH